MLHYVRGNSRPQGWGIGVCVLAGLMTIGLVVGFGMGTNRAESKPAKPVEVAQTNPPTPSQQKVDPDPKPTPTTEPPKKEPVVPVPPPKKETPKKEPPKKDPPKTEPPKPEPPKPEPKTEPPTKMVSFMKDILPIFEDRCTECHKPGLTKGGLDLRTLAGINKGGQGGKALVAGKPAESLIWKTIEDGEMPPAGKKPLTPNEKMLIKQWIRIRREVKI